VISTPRSGNCFQAANESCSISQRLLTWTAWVSVHWFGSTFPASRQAVLWNSPTSANRFDSFLALLMCCRCLGASAKTAFGWAELPACCPISDVSSELRAGYHFCGQRKQPIWAPIDSQLDLAHSKWLDGEEQARMGFGRFRGVQAGLEQRQGGRFPATVLYIVAAVGLCAATASAQTKVSGTAQFAKPDPAHMLPVGDRPDHSLAVEQLKCTWTKRSFLSASCKAPGIRRKASNKFREQGAA